jgi:hypothetical protein
MTKRHNNVGRIIVQAIEANNRKKLVKSISGQFIHWNQELKLPDNIMNPRKFHNVFDRKERREDQTYGTTAKKRKEKELNLS